ncbi:WYL domain-containing protein [Motiliproteus sp. SC1-56]|uniref:WYL domain-containing protein n=1 Tax=Motiliproteus sp. SC1-56 TaxID=2799565 RepID=UPI001A8F3D1B|nr:WYL domain-containing protein [Motiliproteus sp. SC1-56]
MARLSTNDKYWLIELILYWEGRLSTTHLTEFFGISRQQASKDINRYKREHPGCFVYQPRIKRYVPTDGFCPRYLRGDVSEYLDWMAGRQSITVPRHPSFSLPHAAVTHPPRAVSPVLMRPLVQALRERRRIDVDYVSLSNPSRDGRVIVPHTFVKSGLRWHLRAFCEKSGDYRDFVLSRFRGEPEVLDQSSRSASGDLAWNTQVEVALRPDPRLSAAKQEALSHDYGMSGGELRLSTRAALVQYLLIELQVNVKMLDGCPEAQQLVLINQDELKPWLFNG